jgi:hypothetical protein
MISRGRCVPLKPASESSVRHREVAVLVLGLRPIVKLLEPVKKFYPTNRKRLTRNKRFYANESGV